MRFALSFYNLPLMLLTLQVVIFFNFRVLDNSLFSCFLIEEHVFRLVLFNFSKKENFRVKNMLLDCPTV